MVIGWDGFYGVYVVGDVVEEFKFVFGFVLIFYYFLEVFIVKVSFWNEGYVICMNVLVSEVMVF